MKLKKFLNGYFRKINNLIFELQESKQNINNRNRKFQQYEEFSLIYEIKDGRYIDSKIIKTALRFENQFKIKFKIFQNFEL